ncbi:MAG TPA: hypothetical protein VGE28_13495 [Pseudomonas sp.]
MRIEVDVFEQHGTLLQLHSSTVRPAVPGRNWLPKLALAGLILTGGAMVAGKLEEVRRQEVARVAAAEKAEADREAQAEQITAKQVAGLKKRIEVMQAQISQGRDDLVSDLQGVIRDGEKIDDVAVVLRRYPAPVRDLQAIDPSEFEQFLELDREAWIAGKNSPQLDAHYQAERGKLTYASDYLNHFQDAVNFTARGHKLPEWMNYERFRAAPVVAPEGEKKELREQEETVAPTPSPATKPRTAPTGVPGKIQVLDW